MHRSHINFVNILQGQWRRGASSLGWLRSIHGYHYFRSWSWIIQSLWVKGQWSLYISISDSLLINSLSRSLSWELVNAYRRQTKFTDMPMHIMIQLLIKELRMSVEVTVIGAVRYCGCLLLFTFLIRTENLSLMMSLRYVRYDMPLQWWAGTRQPW